jgi:signal transduction histidine kinase
MNTIKKFSESNPFYKNDDYGQGTQSINSLDDLSKLAILHEVGLAITQLLDLVKILDFTEDILVNKLGISECLIYLWNEDSERYDLRHQHGVSKRTRKQIEARRLAGNDLVQQIADKKDAIFISSLGEDDRFEVDFQNKYARYNYLGFPLISRNLVIGVIELIYPIVNTDQEINIPFFKTLGRSIGVAIDNSILVSQIQKQKDDAVTLFKLGTKVTSSLSIKEVLFEIADVGRTILNADIGMVGLFQESCDNIRIWSASGKSAEKLEGLTVNITENSPGNCFLHKKEFIGHVDSDEASHLHNQKMLDDENIKSYLAVPVHIVDRFVGIIEVMNHEKRKFSHNDVILLSQLGSHVFVAVEDAHLHEQLRYGATLEEQNRLARELHDHLAQAMGFIKIKAIMANDQLENGNLLKAKDHVNELINTTSVLYTDLREAIFNLRNTETKQGNFLNQLQEYILEYEQYYGLEVRLSVDDQTTTEFSAEVANQLMRIIQEALSNVRRHSCAQHVWIKFRQVGGDISICIKDDGSGFDPLEIEGIGKSNQSFGLQIMRERVQIIDGKLRIESEPGKGTTVCIQIPSVFIR